MHVLGAQSLADRFAWFVDELCKTIGVDAQRRRMEAALAWAVWNRVRVLGDRLIALIGRARAGRLSVRTKKRPLTLPLPQGERDKRAVMRLPGEFGWVRSALPETGQFAGILQYMLRDPEVAALVEQTPRAGRILRPLCRLLGVQTPAFLRRGARFAEENGGAVAAVARPVAPSAGGTEAEEHRVSAAVLAAPLPSPAMPAEGDAHGAAAAPTPPPPGPQRPLSWLEQDAAAMRERAARWVARHAEAPSTLLALGMPAELALPGTGPPGRKDGG